MKTTLSSKLANKRLAVLGAATAVMFGILLRRRAQQMTMARPHFGQAADEERYLA